MYVLFVVLYVVFFVKQRPAYERRISDWSSDVCSSDLHAEYLGRSLGTVAARRARTRFPAASARIPRSHRRPRSAKAGRRLADREPGAERSVQAVGRGRAPVAQPQRRGARAASGPGAGAARSLGQRLPVGSRALNNGARPTTNHTHTYTNDQRS